MPEGKKVVLHFPKHFLWGASVSTHQVEGGNNNQWSQWELETAQVKVAQARYNYGHLPIWNEIKDQAQSPENYVSGEATDHYNKFQLDFDIAKKLRFTALRTGVEWSRIEPEQGVFDAKEIDHYKTYFSELKKRGITPVITLWHWTMPDWFAKKGGFEKRTNVKYFTRYVTRITKELGIYFNYVITINEPTVYAAYSYHEQLWPPQKGSKIATVRVLRNLAIAHNKAYKVIKKQRPKAKVGLAHNCASFYAGDDSAITRTVVKLLDLLENRIFINRVRRKQDFFGLNYYFANRVIGTRVHNPTEHTNDAGWSMEPDKLQPLVEHMYKKYKRPIIITESGVADMHDQYRKWWITESIKALDGAIKNGVPVLGYIHWSLLDNFEWEKGFWPRFGLVEIDYKTQKRTVRPSALWYGRLIRTLSE